MAKKKYRTSGKPKVSGMNEYIYNTLKDDLAKEYKVARPYKPKKVKQAQAMKNVTVNQGKPQKYKPEPEPKTFREAGMKYGQGPKSKGGKPLKNVTPPGIDARIKTKSNIKAGVGIGEIIGTESKSKKAFGIGRRVGKRVMTGDVIGYKIATAKSPSDIIPPKQKVKGTYKGKQPLYKSGTSSPVKKVTGKALSGTAKKAVLARGAKLAAKGASRLIPGVGTAMLAKDVYDVLTKSEATKYVPQYGAKISKKYKKKNY